MLMLFEVLASHSTDDWITDNDKIAFISRADS